MRSLARGSAAKSVEEEGVCEEVCVVRSAQCVCVCVCVGGGDEEHKFILANFFEGIQTNCLRITHESPLDFIVDEL